jgi:hypothetical protein
MTDILSALGPEPTDSVRPVPSPPKKSSLVGIQELLEQKRTMFSDDPNIIRAIEKMQLSISKIQSQEGFESKNIVEVENILITVQKLSGGNPANGDYLVKAQIRATALVIKMVAERVLPLCHGKVNNIWTIGEKETATHVYGTPRDDRLLPRIGESKQEAKLREELTTAADIKRKLKEKALLSLADEIKEQELQIANSIGMIPSDDQLELLAEEVEGQGKHEIAEKIRNQIGRATRNLSIDFEEVVDPEEKIHGRFTLKSEKASGDLEERLAGELLIEDPWSFGEQLLQGMVDLQNAGYAHGDLKAENILLYEQRLKIADFGKARLMQPSERKIYTGNARYEPPEGRMSLQGDVYSTGLLMIRILEKNFLTDESPTLVTITERTRKSISPEASRRGVEKFVSEHKDCPQTETTELKGMVTVFSRRALYSINTPSGEILSRAEEAIQTYIEALATKIDFSLRRTLITRGIVEPALTITIRAAIDPLKILLTRMTLSNPTKRPTMAEALATYKPIAASIHHLLTAPHQ